MSVSVDLHPPAPVVSGAGAPVVRRSRSSTNRCRAGPVPPPPRPLPITRRGRSLCVLDLENLAGGPSDSYRAVAALWARVVDPRPPDLVVCGCDVTGAFAARDAFPSARLVVGRGPDGADRRLVEVIEEASGLGRFDTVVLGSGDGIFTEPLARVAQQGLLTWVIAPEGHLARRLREVARRVVTVPVAS